MHNLKYFLIIVVTLFSVSIFALDKKAEYYNEDKLGIAVTPNKKEFVIKLKSNRTTGYSWFLSEFDEEFLEPQAHSYEVTQAKVAGSPGFQVWKFKVNEDAFKVPQQSPLKFVYARPWDGNEQAKEVVFKVSSVF